MLDIDKIYTGDCLDLFSSVDDDSVDLVVTSPPYNLGIKYDVYHDTMPWDEYFDWSRLWVKEVYRVLKPDGRFCLNHYLSCGTSVQRVAPLMDLQFICEHEIGFKHHGLAVWWDITLTKRTAWGSWLSSSAPYINCLTGDALVITDSGIKRLDAIYKGDMVLSFGGIFSDVVSSHVRPHSGRCIKITTQSNLVDPIVCTGEHLFYVRVRNTTFTTYNGSNNRRYLFSPSDWISADTIIKTHNKGGVGVISVAANYGRDTDTRVFIGFPVDTHSNVPENISPELMWIVGFYLAEGNLVRRETPREKRAWRIYLTTHIDEYDDVASRLNVAGFHFQCKKWEMHCRFEIDNKALYLFLEQFYIEGAMKVRGSKSHLKILPEWVIQLPNEYLTCFIDGYFEGDGCVFPKRKTEGKMIVSTSKHLLIQVQRILFKLGKYARITRAVHAGKDVSFGGKLVNHKDRYNLIWYEHITKFSPAIFEDGMIWIQIKNIEETEYAGLVYDLTISDTHSYCLPQGLTHNSPFEGVLILFKDRWKKDHKGESTITKEEFMESCSGIWKISTERKRDNPAPFPVALPRRCINLLTYKGDLVLDPFVGGGSTAVAAKETGRHFIGFEMSPKYVEIAEERLRRIS